MTVKYNDLTPKQRRADDMYSIIARLVLDKMNDEELATLRKEAEHVYRFIFDETYGTD